MCLGYFGCLGEIGSVITSGKAPDEVLRYRLLYMSKVNAAQELMIGWLIEWAQWKVFISLASKSNVYRSRKSSQFWQRLRSLHCWRCTMGVNLVDHKLKLITASSVGADRYCASTAHFTVYRATTID